MFCNVTADNLHKQERFYFQAILVRKGGGKPIKSVKNSYYWKRWTRAYTTANRKKGLTAKCRSVLSFFHFSVNFIQASFEVSKGRLM